jgi:hypothetical protein
MIVDRGCCIFCILFCTALLLLLLLFTLPVLLPFDDNDNDTDDDSMESFVSICNKEGPTRDIITTIAPVMTKTITTISNRVVVVRLVRASDVVPLDALRLHNSCAAAGNLALSVDDTGITIIYIYIQ